MLEPPSWQMKLQSLNTFKATRGAANAKRELRQGSVSFPATRWQETRVRCGGSCGQALYNMLLHPVSKKQDNPDISAELVQTGAIRQQGLSPVTEKPGFVSNNHICAAQGHLLQTLASPSATRPRDAPCPSAAPCLAGAGCGH